MHTQEEAAPLQLLAPRWVAWWVDEKGTLKEGFKESIALGWRHNSLSPGAACQDAPLPASHCDGIIEGCLEGVGP